MTSRLARIACGLLVLAVGGCEASKSSNPTAPTVAGPIPGVNISAPVMLEPAQGFKFKESEQPIRLVVQNATTNGVRALTYTFEVATDAAFTTKVFSRSGVAPGDGKTSVQIDRLEIGRAYFWRAWAADGANTGAAAIAGFEIFPKPAVSAPGPISPINNEVVATTTPVIRVRNASWVGPVGGLVYEFQVATDQAFSRLIAASIVSEGSGQTTFNSTPLTGAATMYWRARASDGQTTSSWSTTQVFRTPAPPAPTPPAPPTGGGGGGNGGSCASASGTFIVNCISAKYPERLVAGISLSQRQANMSFLRDRMIEAGRCGGLDLGWNLKRGGPDVSIDFITQRINGTVDGIDLGFDYDNTRTPLRLTWGTGGSFPFYGPYTNSFSCK
ncbi:MAG TPA: hypothetical protein VNC21_00465 [Vicinamibacterales bacterium]|nr:hypothetical protein [Vicinamibacterales bacterium]